MYMLSSTCNYKLCLRLNRLGVRFSKLHTEVSILRTQVSELRKQVIIYLAFKDSITCDMF